MNLVIACSLLQRLKGLFGRSGFTGVLLLVPCNDIHSFGMQQAIDVAFISADGTVLKSYTKLKPQKRCKCKEAVATLERFARDAPWFETGDKIFKDIVVLQDLEDLQDLEAGGRTS